MDGHEKMLNVIGMDNQAVPWRQGFCAFHMG